MAFANLVRGVPLNAAHEYAGTVADLINPYALLGGAATLALFVLHGAVFVALKTTGEVRRRAGRIARVAVAAAIVVGGAYLLLTQLLYGKPVTWPSRRGGGPRTGRRGAGERTGPRGLGLHAAPARPSCSPS